MRQNLSRCKIIVFSDKTLSFHDDHFTIHAENIAQAIESEYPGIIRTVDKHTSVKLIDYDKVSAALTKKGLLISGNSHVSFATTLFKGSAGKLLGPAMEEAVLLSFNRAVKEAGLPHLELVNYQSNDLTHPGPREERISYRHTYYDTPYNVNRYNFIQDYPAELGPLTQKLNNSELYHEADRAKKELNAAVTKENALQKRIQENNATILKAENSFNNAMKSISTQKAMATKANQFPRRCFSSLAPNSTISPLAITALRLATKVMKVIG